MRGTGRPPIAARRLGIPVPRGCAASRAGRRSAGSDGWWPGMAGLALVLAVGGGIAVAARRFGPRAAAGAVQVVGRVSLSPKHSVYLLRVGRRVLLVGAGPAGAARADHRAGRCPRGPARTSSGGRIMIDGPSPGRQLSRATGGVGRGSRRCSPSSARVPAPHADDRRAARRRLPAVGAAAARSSAHAAASGPTGPRSWSRPTSRRSPRLRSSRRRADSLQTVALFGLISLAPVALLMVTAFVRINIVLTLLRQALGSPQVPGNQVLTALALLLTALVMWPSGETVYRGAISPYAGGAGRRSPRPGRRARSRSRRSWSSRSNGPGTRTTWRPSTSTRPRPAPGRRSRPRDGPRTSRSASWRRPSCSAS